MQASLSSIRCFPDTIFILKNLKGKYYFKNIVVNRNKQVIFYSKARDVFRCSCDRFCISLINFSTWVNTLLLLCAVIYSESYWQTLWISRKIGRNKCFSHIHFVFNQNVFKFVLKFNWIGRSSPHNYDTSFPHFFCLYSVHYKNWDSRTFIWFALAYTECVLHKIPDLKFADVILWCCLLHSSENY